MAPIQSKPVPAPSFATCARNALKEAIPTVNALVEVIRENLELGKVTINGSFAPICDSMVASVVRGLENACFLDLTKLVRREPSLIIEKRMARMFVVWMIMSLYHTYVFIYMPAMGISLFDPASILFHAVVFLTLQSYLHACQTDPGGPPEGPEWRDQGTPPFNVPESAILWDRRSGRYVPERSRYCKTYQRHVLRMDHMCPWLANVVGHLNHKYFYLFSLYSTSTCAYLGVNLSRCVMQPGLSAISTSMLLGGGMLATTLASALLPFTAWHTWLLCSNRTTMEFADAWAKSKGGGKFEPSAYDVGVYRNICQVMGDNPLLWPFPVGGPSGDGISFPKSALETEKQAASDKQALLLEEGSQQTAEAGSPDVGAALLEEATQGSFAVSGGGSAGLANFMTHAARSRTVPNEHFLLGPPSGASFSASASSTSTYAPVFEGETGEDAKASLSYWTEGCEGIPAAPPSSLAAAVGETGDEALAWQSTEEFLDDLKVGASVIQETVQDHVVAAVAQLVSCCRPPWSIGADQGFRACTPMTGRQIWQGCRVALGGGERRGTSESGATSGAKFLSSTTSDPFLSF